MTMTGNNFASASIVRHLLRGGLGFGLLIGSVALIPMLGLASMLIAPVGIVALRGCPTCWAVGLAQTISMGRLQRSCADGRCQLAVAEPTPSPKASDVATSASCDLVQTRRA
jgi:hypothetical protein